MAMDRALAADVQTDPLRTRTHRLVLASLLTISFAVVAQASLPKMYAAPDTPGRIHQGFTMSAGSMIPTLLVGDVVTAVALSALPQRGDVIVFKVPGKHDVPYVKRVMALPGDTIQMKDGRVYLNAVMLPRESTAKVRTDDFYGKDTEMPTYLETLPSGSRHLIIEIQGDRGFIDNTELFTVPKDAVFVMGDNRDNSTDSRIPADQEGLGFVAAKDIIGRADFIVGSKTRKDRGLMPIQ